MTKETILKNLRRTVIIQCCISAFVLLLCWLMGWFYPYTIGLVFTWVGVIFLLSGGFAMFGGMLSGGEDLSAFSLSSAGKMENHLSHIREAGAVRHIFVIFSLANGIIPIFIGYLLQTLGNE